MKLSTKNWYFNDKGQAIRVHRYYTDDDGKVVALIIKNAKGSRYQVFVMPHVGQPIAHTFFHFRDAEAFIWNNKY
jgi:hypothetical protein